MTEKQLELLKRKANDWNAEADRYLAQRDELFVALQKLADDYEQLCGDGLTESNQPPVLVQARAALRKVAAAVEQLKRSD